jgi:hypothetical protein
MCSELTTAIPLSCGHIYCSTCFYHQTCTVIHDMTSSHFPLKCWTPGCELPISLGDLQTHLMAEHFTRLLTSAVNIRIRQSPKEYRACARPDCPAIYARDTTSLTTCHLCLAQYCPRYAQRPHSSLYHAPSTAAYFTHRSIQVAQPKCWCTVSRRIS